MNWGSLVSTLVPTIGSIVGQLLNAKSIEDGVVSYRFSRGANELGEDGSTDATFVHDGDDYALFNQSTKAADTVTMAFPATSTIGPQTLIVPGRTCANVTQLFKDNAEMDNCAFALTAGGNDATTAQDGNPTVKISCSGKNIPVGDGKRHTIGSYLDVQVDTGSVTIYPKTVSLASLPMVSVRGTGETTAQILNASGQSGSLATVNFPSPFSAGELVEVEIMANVGGLTSDRLMAQSGGILLTAITDDQFERLAKAKRLNWE